MAFYKELCRRQWHCINGENQIRYYKKYLYDRWYESLSEDDKRYLEEQKKKREEQSKKHLQESLHTLAIMTGMVADLYKRGISNKEKYHGFYDEAGFPNL